MTLALALSALPVWGDITSYRDENGRLVYVNSTDSELTQAASRGGASAAIILIEKRKKRLKGVQEHIEATAKTYQVDPRLVYAMIEVESAWRPSAVSKAGALGLMQLMPSTAKELGVRDPFDPNQNITGGVRYLRKLLDRFNNNLTLSLAAYNAGPNAVSSYGGVPPFQETLNYLERIRTKYGRATASRPSRYGSIYPSVDSDGKLVYINE